MTMPTHQCPWRMQVHHIHQETPDVWTISLLCHDYYPYRAGQYALVSVRNSADTLRAYTISSTPGVSEYITLTIRRLWCYANHVNASLVGKVPPASGCTGNL